MRTNIATKRSPVAQVGTKADTIAARDAEPLGYNGNETLDIRFAYVRPRHTNLCLHDTQANVWLARRIHYSLEHHSHCSLTLRVERQVLDGDGDRGMA